MLGYDLEIKPTKLVTGHGLAQLMIEANYENLKIKLLFNTSSELDSGLHVIIDFSLCPWYTDIVYVLQNLQAAP